jgi:Xaa-Pro aminopeptidase
MSCSGRLGRFFGKQGVDALVLANGESADPNFSYYAGLFLDNTVFLALRGGGTFLLVNSINEEEARGTDCEVLVWKDRAGFWNGMRKALGTCRSVGIDPAGMKASTYIGLRRRLRGKRIVDCSEKLGMQRAVKDSGEIALLRKSARIARRIIREADVRARRSELDIAGELKVAAFEAGAGISFEPIVLSGIRTAMPHGKPSGKKLAVGDAVLVDFGVSWKGYCSDITRCFFLGACRKERERYSRLREVFLELADGAGAGTSCSKVAGECDALLAGKGFGKLMHAPGHGIGLAVHEEPRLSRNAGGKLLEGMTVALEPAFYGKYGLRYEDDLIVRKSCARPL